MLIRRELSKYNYACADVCLKKTGIMTSRLTFFFSFLRETIDITIRAIGSHFLFIFYSFRLLASVLSLFLRPYFIG